MAFTIERVATEQTWVPLVLDPNPFGENVFSLIVGQNATGKSRLLRKIVSNYVFSNDDVAGGEVYFRTHTSAWWRHENNLPPSREVMVSYQSKEKPSIVIAVSTGRHDRFPKQREIKSLLDGYHYIAPSEHGSPSALTRSLISILEGLKAHQWKFGSLAHVFEYLNFEPILDFNVALDNRARKYLSSSGREESADEIDWFGEPRFVSRNQDKYGQVIDRLLPMLEYLKKRKIINCEINLRSLGRTHSALDIQDLADALEHGLVRVTDLTLNLSSTKKRLKLSQTSSGQQCILTMILGIAGSIQDDALICIDEPEISLHPQWQSDVIGHLQNAFSEYRGCHFVIATHSPQIVAGLTSDNGYILSLEDKNIYRSSEYANRSADFQLAQVFNAPGFNNEYLIRIALTVLSKISRRNDLTEVDARHIDMLSEIKGRLSEGDPVRHLINQIQILR